MCTVQVKDLSLCVCVLEALLLRPDEVRNARQSKNNIQNHQVNLLTKNEMTKVVILNGHKLNALIIPAAS